MILFRPTKDFGVEEEDKEEEMEAGEENFVIANFKAGEFLAAVYRRCCQHTDSHILMSFMKPASFKQWN